jgi:hypothetical protein
MKARRSGHSIFSWATTSVSSSVWSTDGIKTRRLELEYTPTKFLQIEIGPTISYYDIRGAPGLNDRNSGVLNGVSATI